MSTPRPAIDPTGIIAIEPRGGGAAGIVTRMAVRT